jgi:glycosyltransferase involved in cell wall biosynthesis
MPEPTPVDVLLVSPGTTAGWRRVDRELAALLEELGLSTATAFTDFRIAGPLRRGVLLTDLVEAAAMRRALTRALRRHRPRAIVYSSPQATMLQPRRRLRGATAVRFDEPAVSNRHGPGTGVLHLLERRALAQMRLLLPLGVEPPPAVRLLRVETPMVALPVAIEVTWDEWSAREPTVVVYAGNPYKKGLDLAVAAWARASLPGWRLLVTGIEEQAGRLHLERHEVDEPDGVEWAGIVPPDRYAEVLGKAAVFLSASRHEDYGLAQLEALGAGAVLVTSPATGPYPALELARALDHRLVAGDASSAALATALELALEMPDSAQRAYAERARELLIPHSRAELLRRVAQQVLPVLLGEERANAYSCIRD